MARIALVTGAGSGIGRAVALALLAEGFDVALAGRRRETLEETARLAGTAPQRTLLTQADVSDPRAVDNLFDEIAMRFGRLDVLFNNAGASGPAKSFEDLTYEDWTRVVSTNLTGAFLCAQGAFRLMRRQDPQGGRIINNGSLSAHAPRPHSAPYTASKHAITGLTRSLSLDGRAFGICCGQIDIGNAATEMGSHVSDGARQADGSLRVEPVMDVADVARSVAFMAGLPLEANVPFMTVMANAMPFIGRG